ncbi:nudix hydrolase 10-like isoform X3 [Camellia sinensis]|uniref:nudix hydrolase 10-like isoform X3 n=1 Tax=Camellia sinensis TaxID=4442 RepID=UPI001035C5B6|nr:nudix hydrolase 10-like isoform X3 [Camellia sinensis]
MDQVVAENGVQQVELLFAVNDDHGGVIVEMKEPMDSKAFLSLLRASISQWKQQGKNGVWIKLPIGLVNLVETAVKLLVVQEKSGRLQGKGIWKIPTGVVDEGEDIFAAAVREVKEETNIDTEFVEILAFRQFHKVFFEKSDLSFLCILSPLSFDIQKQELEIEAAQWMPFEEYAAQPITQKHGLFKYISEICLAKVDREYVGFSPLPMTSSFDDQVTYIYLNNHDLNQ